MAQRSPAVSFSQCMALHGTHALKGWVVPGVDSVSWQRFFAEDEACAGHFLAIARCGSFNQAARRFGLRVDVLRKGITRLEQRLGSRLFVQKNSVLELTAAGKYLHTLVRATVDTARETMEVPIIMPIRLSIPPMLLEGALFRSLISWLRKNAGSRVVLQEPDRDDTPAPDVWIWFGTPGEFSFPADVIEGSQQIARLRYLPYIAGSYASKRIIPNCLEDLDDYMLVQYQEYRQLMGLQSWNEVIDRRRHGVMQVQSYEVLRELVRWSGCIGLLTENTGSQNRNFLPLAGLFPQAITLEVWIGINPASPYLLEAQRIMAMMAQACAEYR